MKIDTQNKNHLGQYQPSFSAIIRADRSLPSNYRRVKAYAKKTNTLKAIQNATPTNYRNSIRQLNASDRAEKGYVLDQLTYKKKDREWVKIPTKDGKGSLNVVTQGDRILVTSPKGVGNDPKSNTDMYFFPTGVKIMQKELPTTSTRLTKPSVK